MIHFLMKRAERYAEKKGQEQERTAYGMFAGYVGISCNVFLFVLKLIVGFLSGSLAVMADAFNNLSDAASSLISAAGAGLAGKPADEDHPFGHGRIEYIAALIVSFLIIEVGIRFFMSSVSKISSPQTLVFTRTAFVLLVLSVLIKLWMFAFYSAFRKRTGSAVLRAAAMDSLFDALTTSATIASLLIYRIKGLNIDAYTGILVALIVIYAGIGLIRDTISPLISEEVDPELYRQVEQIVRQQDKVLSTHDLIIHHYGPGRSMATIHVEVSRKMNIEDAHEVADAAEKEVRRQTGVNLVAHVDPAAPDDARVIRLQEQVERILNILDPALKFHDFQADFTADEVLVKFDLAVPFTYTREMEAKIVEQIGRLLKEMNPLCRCEILVDKGFYIEEL